MIAETDILLRKVISLKILTMNGWLRPSSLCIVFSLCYLPWFYHSLGLERSYTVSFSNLDKDNSNDIRVATLLQFYTEKFIQEGNVL